MIRPLSYAALIAAPLVCPPAYAQRQQPLPVSREVRRAVLDSVRQAMLTYYVFPDTATSMAAYLVGRRNAGAFDTVTNPNALAGAITRELRRAHNDPHLRVVYDPQEAARAVDTTHREARDALARDRKQNFYFREARILPGNIGYLEFRQFADTSEDARKTVQAAMRFVANTEALIIDLRDNRGGSDAMAGEIAGYFVKHRVHWGDTYNRLMDKWTEGWTENRPAITGGIYLGMPITVLTSSWTFSAAEGMAYGLKYGRNARIVGQPTAGGAHVLRRVALGNGFVGFIPYMRSANVVTKTDWEGTGVAPDILADPPHAMLRAQEAILAERMAAAKDTMARRASAWAINEARAQALDVDVPLTTLRDFAGRFEEYTFSVRENRLYSENSSRNGKTDKLKAITPALFQIDWESQVEFVRDATGLVASVRIFWNDGWVDIIARAK